MLRDWTRKLEEVADQKARLRKKKLASREAIFSFHKRRKFGEKLSVNYDTNFHFVTSWLKPISLLKSPKKCRTRSKIATERKAANSRKITVVIGNKIDFNARRKTWAKIFVISFGSRRSGRRKKSKTWKKKHSNFLPQSFLFYCPPKIFLFLQLRTDELRFKREHIVSLDISTRELFFASSPLFRIFRFFAGTASDGMKSGEGSHGQVRA